MNTHTAQTALQAAIPPKNQTPLPPVPGVQEGSLILVNASHPLHAPLPQSALESTGGQNPVWLARRPAKILQALLQASQTTACVAAVSGYRSHEQQTALYHNTLRQHGEAYTHNYVALPGCSEHETGLAVDLAAVSDEGYDPICPSLPYNGPYARLRAMATAYGFVERYPAGKQHITGIAHEPWHFRYVGWPHSAIMAENGLVLEEYVSLLHNHVGYRNALRYTGEWRHASVFCAAPGDAPQVAAALPQPQAWVASGDNDGWVVFTVWE